MGCNGNCSSCGSSCSQKCPTCQHPGMPINHETVNALVSDKIKFSQDNQIFICTNRDCATVYYQDDLVADKTEVLVKVWFKEEPKNMTVCYCYDITLNDVIDVIKNNPSEKRLSKEEVIKLLGKDKIKVDCLHKNPISQDCNMLFLNAIMYAYDKLKR